MTRINKEVYSYLNRFPRNLVLPHRLMPYPESVLKKYIIYSFPKLKLFL